MVRSSPEKSVGIASQFASVGDLLAHFLATQERFFVTWKVNLAADAISQCGRKTPAVLIISPFFPDLSGMDLVLAIRRQNPEVKILLFTGTIHQEMVRGMMAAQVHGIISASSPLTSLVTALSILKDGGCYFDRVAQPLLHPVPAAHPSHLTKRERLVLRLVAEGFSTKEIADQLHISIKTADKFREHIMRKLNLHDAVKLTRYAIRAGISSIN